MIEKNNLQKWEKKKILSRAKSLSFLQKSRAKLIKER